MAEGLRHQHWEDFGDIHREQAEICNAMTNLELDTIAKYGLQRRGGHNFVTGVRGHLPYGAPYMKLPHDLFLDDEKPQLPASREEAALLASRHKQRTAPDRRIGHDYGPNLNIYNFCDPTSAGNPGVINNQLQEIVPLTLNEDQWQYRTLTDNNRTLYGRLVQLMEADETIDTSKWNIYRRMGKRILAMNSGPVHYGYDLNINSMHRMINSQRMRNNHKDVLPNLPLGKFEFFLHSRSATEFRYFKPSEETRQIEVESAFPAAFIDLPIGNYGIDFTHNVLRWTLHGIERAESILNGYTLEIERKHSPEFDYYWGHGKDGYYGGLRDTLIATHISGKQAVAHAIMLLTAEYVDGYATGTELLRDLVKADLVAKFARQILLGLTAPPVLEGIYFEGLVRKKGNGDLDLNPDILKELAVKRKKFQLRMAEVWQDLRSPGILAEVAPDIPDFAGFICPAAYQNGAISKQARNCLDWCENNDSPYAPIVNRGVL